MNIDFSHRQSAHCESDVTANLLFHYGIEISEAMAFGIGSGLFFGYLPFVRVNRLPLETFRSAPGAIFKRVARRLGVEVARQKFRSPERSMAALDQALGRHTLNSRPLTEATAHRLVAEGDYQFGVVIPRGQATPFGSAPGSWRARCSRENERAKRRPRPPCP